jgi:two-component system, LytTR family, sensor kinase
VIKMKKNKRRFAWWKVIGTVLGLNIAFYLVLLTLYAAVPELFSKQLGFPEGLYLIDQFISSMVLGNLLYFMLNYYYGFIAEKRSFIHYLSVSVGAIIIYVTYLIIERYFFRSLASNYSSTSTLVFFYTLNSIFLIGVNLLIAYLFYLRDEKKQRKILEEQKLQLEIEKIHANYNFLKAQINPHFLHNTLNFLYAKSIPYSPELSEGILTLSEIMRYALGESSVKDGKAALKDEIEHMRNIIKIHQLRFGNSLQVQFEVNGIVNGAVIIPFVLITIVENAFKHGNLKSAEHPIEIKLTIEQNSLFFYCRNKKKTGPKELSTGIGLDNIKKRLDLAYGNQYGLSIKDESDLYTSQLTIHTL